MVQTGLNLLTTYTSTSDKSSTDDGSTSLTMEDHKQTASEVIFHVINCKINRFNLFQANDRLGF